MVRVLKKILIFLIYFSGFISLICIVNSFREVFSLKSDCSFEGVKTFFNTFLSYKDIHSLTLAVLGIYLVIEQIEIAFYANRITSRLEWKSRLENKLKDFDNIIIKNYFSEKSNEIFDFLLHNNLRVSNIRQLKKFFKKFLNDKIEDFEKSTNQYNTNSCHYEKPDQSYSIEGVKTLVTDLIDPEISYVNFTKNFNKLYMKIVKNFNSDKIKK
ncbi:MAG: hypothetical protein HY951_03185 [Bacteroidia bacterium]|nr:hypothetical protein [Bacteroidia bacterium]